MKEGTMKSGIKSISRRFADFYFGDEPKIPEVRPIRPPPGCGRHSPAPPPRAVATHTTPIGRIDNSLEKISRELRATGIDPAKEELRIEFEKFRDSFEKYRLIKIMSKHEDDPRG